MVSEDAITATLQGSIEDFIRHAPFFKAWVPGAVDRAQAERFLASFDALVRSFPALIAAGIARAPDESTRVVLAVNLFQECGEGDPRRTHWAIYRRFLETAGIAPADREIPNAAQWRQTLMDYVLKAQNPGAVLGALASGEFLAQPALSRLYAVLKPLFPQADQEYFTHHLALETEHMREIASLLARQLKEKPDWDLVQRGFKDGLLAWGDYFNALGLDLKLSLQTPEGV